MKLYKITKTYSEERDCGAKLSLPEYNVLKVATVDNGVGKYIVIETQRWALDEESLEGLVEELRNILKEANS